MLERIGTFPNSLVLGATCQVQRFTLHLVALVHHLLRLVPSRLTLLSG